MYMQADSPGRYGRDLMIAEAGGVVSLSLLTAEIALRYRVGVTFVYRRSPRAALEASTICLALVSPQFPGRDRM